MTDKDPHAIPSIDADDVRELAARRSAEALVLLDVRQPTEYEEEHIPGAQLVPLDQLPERLDELSQGRKVVTYCRRGARGAAAAALLLNAGFTDVKNLEGGLDAWNGLIVEGAPQSGRDWFASASTIGELIALAFSFEEGARLFYEAAAREVADETARAMFSGLARAEVHHQATLRDLGEKIVGEGFSLPEGRPEQMEGGAPLDEALGWIEGKDPRTILEYAMALETIAYDRYVQLAREAEDSASARVFRLIADGERLHLRQILDVFEGVL